MDLTYGPEYEAFREQVRTFLAAHAHEAPVAGSPRDAQSATRSRCVGGGVTMSTRSGFVASSIACASVYARAPVELAAAPAFARSVSHQPTTSTSSIARHPAVWNWLK